MSYTEKDVQDLARLQTRLFNVSCALEAVFSEFMNLDIDTGRVAEALGRLNAVRDSLRGASNLVSDEHDRIEAVVERERLFP